MFFLSKKTIKKVLAVLILTTTVMPFILTGCNKKTGDLILLGAPITYYVADSSFKSGSNADKQIYENLYDLKERFNQLFSVEDDSVISAYNTENGTKTISVPQEFYFVLQTFDDVYNLTDGAINPQVKLLVDLWGFSRRYREAGYTPQTLFDRERLSGGGFLLPDDKYINAFKTLSDFSLVDYYANDDGYFVVKPDLSVTVDGVTYYSQLDFASAVKGYYCDLAAEIFRKNGVKSFYISAGGSSMYLSDYLGEDWNLKIVDPFSSDRSPYLSVPVKDKFVTTSGTYENFYTVDGVTYCHIIDQNTASPTQSDLVSVTLIGDSGILSDALSTAVLNMGSLSGSEFLSKLDEYDYILIKSDGTVISNIDNLTYENKA